MHLVYWKKSPIRRKLSGLSTRVKNKRFYQTFGNLVMYHYSHLGIWYVLKLSLLAKHFLLLKNTDWFNKVHWKRKPELYDIIYYVTLCEKDIQAVMIQRCVRKFLYDKRELRTKQVEKARVLQRWWRHVLQTKIYPEKEQKAKNFENRSKCSQTIFVNVDSTTQTEKDTSSEQSDLVIADQVTLKTVGEGLTYIINCLERCDTKPSTRNTTHEEILPVAKALAEAVKVKNSEN